MRGWEGGADEGLTRRLKALACTAPLHDLDARKSLLDWADASVYQMAEIALHTIDQVTVTMDFDTGADHDRIVDRVVGFVAKQAPGRAPGEHAHVARWVLENLINIGTVDRGFRRVYGAVTPGGYQRLAFDFKLLVELPAPEGGVYLRATDEAINVLVGALDTDVESAQIAAEVKLEHLIARGRLADARLAAEQARYRTVQFGETLRARLDATRRDVRSVDWETEVPELIDAALDHIAARFRAENAILRNITAARDDTSEPERKRRAAELVEIVGDCIARHTRLQLRVQEAGAVFRAEQDRQEFGAPARRATVDLYGHLLAPVLELTVADAAAPLGAYVQAASGLDTPTAPSLSGLVALLLRPAPDRDALGAEDVAPELVQRAEPERFDEALWAHADELLHLPEAPRRLSGLLADARRIDPELPKLVALRALHAYSPPVGAALRGGERYVLVAVDDGEPLRDEQFRGADLILSSVGVVTEGDQ